jgi:hypothetical protein
MHQLQSAKGTDARHQTAKELAKPLGGALNTGPVSREVLNRIAGIVGGILLGAAFLFLTRRTDTRRRHDDVPVEKLAEDLKHAWAGYHNA